MAQVMGRRYSAVSDFGNEAEASKAATLIKKGQVARQEVVSRVRSERGQLGRSLQAVQVLSVLSTPSWLSSTSRNGRTHDDPADWTAHIETRTIGTEGSEFIQLRHRVLVYGDSPLATKIACTFGSIRMSGGIGKRPLRRLARNARTISLLANEAVPSICDA